MVAPDTRRTAPRKADTKLLTDSSTLTPAAKEALRRIKALRLLPQSEVVTQAEKRALRNLNTAETLAVALELAEEAEKGGAQ